jgi:hypothetical protein
MAVTVTYGEQERVQGLGGFTVQHGTIAFDNSYAAGGETAGESWDDGRIINVFIDPLASNATYAFSYDDATDTVFGSTRADGLEIAGTTDLEAVIVPFWVVKKK